MIRMTGTKVKSFSAMHDGMYRSISDQLVQHYTHLVIPESDQDDV